MTDAMDRARDAAAAVLDLPPRNVVVRLAGRGIGGGRPRARTDDQIRAAVSASSSYRAAARSLGVSDSTVRAACKRLGISPKSAPRKGLQKKRQVREK